jgi:SAM-dependent methyltransferase
MGWSRQPALEAAQVLATEPPIPRSRRTKARVGRSDISTMTSAETQTVLSHGGRHCAAPRGLWSPRPRLATAAGIRHFAGPRVGASPLGCPPKFASYSNPDAQTGIITASSSGRSLGESPMIEDRSSESRWIEHGKFHSDLISDSTGDSEYLHSLGIAENILGLIGDVTGLRVLDAGCGNGWLFDRLRPDQGWECDIAPLGTTSRKFNFSSQRIQSTNYPSDFFDISVCCMVLQCVADFRQALHELNRVTKATGKLIVAIPHPYFYQTGQASHDNTYKITRDLSQLEHSWEFYISGSVGPFIYYYRPIYVYHNAMIQAGWRLNRLLDWFITQDDHELLSRTPSYGVPRSSKVPIFTFLEASK